VAKIKLQKLATLVFKKCSTFIPREVIEMLYLLSIGLAFFIIAISPGPANISNAAVAMSHGKKLVDGLMVLFLGYLQ